MFKMLVTLGVFLVVALTLLAVRTHRLEVTSESARIHEEIKQREQTLLDQRAQIAQQVTPWTLVANLKAAGMDAGDAVVSHAITTPPTVRQQSQTPAVETDLVAPLMNNNDSGGSGHSNRNRPH